MTRSLTIVALLAALAPIPARAAPAGELAATAPTAAAPRTVGIGAARTLAGVAGLELADWLGRAGLVTVTVGLASFDGTGVKFQQARVGVAYFGPIAYLGRTRALLGARIDLGVLDPSGAAARRELELEVPLRIEAWLSPAVAIHAEVGALVDMVGEDGGGFADPEAGSRDPGLHLRLGTGGAFGAGGLTYYF